MTIILYTRPGCHLCVRAKETLEIAQDRFAFAIVERNIDENPAWKESFGEDIPVVVIDGKKVFRHVVREKRLYEYLEADAGRSH